VGTVQSLYLKVVTGASGIQKMKPTESDDFGDLRGELPLKFLAAECSVIRL
jgi:hypothetical protein